MMLFRTSTVGTINMFSSGIGGGGFLIIRPPNDPLDSLKKKHHPHPIPVPHPDTQPISIDFRETSSLPPGLVEGQIQQTPKRPKIPSVSSVQEIALSADSHMPVVIDHAL
jgi:hypothetical protein